MRAYNVRPNALFKIKGTHVILRRVDCFFIDEKPTPTRQGGFYANETGYILAICEKDAKPDIVFFVPLMEEVECL